MAETPRRTPTHGRKAKNESESSLFPPIKERLGYVRPSQELLEFYRTKFMEYDKEYDNLVKKLDKYHSAYEQVHKSRWEIRQREDEIKELQKALSDMQVFLFQEREHVLRLYAENDRLKIKELEDRKRIQHLLSLTKPGSVKETTYFVKESPQVLVEQHLYKDKGHQQKASICAGRGPGGHRTHQNKENSEEQKCECETLLLTVEALKAQLEEQTRLCKEQVDALLEDRRVHMEESQTLQDRDAAKIQSLSDQLHTTQSMLYDSTKDYLDLKYELRTQERAWMADRDALLSQMEEYKERLDVSDGIDSLLVNNYDHQEGPDGTTDGPRRIPSAKQLKMQLLQAEQIADNYREQCIHMEQELCRLREQDDASKDLFTKRSEKMMKRLQLMNQRYEALEKRRKLEIEGYKNDIKILRQRLKEVEKQLYKVSLCMGGDQDSEILSYVKSTSKNAKKLIGDLQNLKAKVYSLENNVRHIHDH